MNWEEFFKLLIGTLFTGATLLLGFNAKSLLAQLKELSTNVANLQTALQESTAQIGQLNGKVDRLDKENASLRRSHDVLTRFLIGIGILPAPPPSTLNEV